MTTMKYAKKMKLVDIDDDTTRSSSLQPSDSEFMTPRILSTLDGSMNEILSRRDIDDSEKWILYNQTLQKFLNYMKKHVYQINHTHRTYNKNSETIILLSRLVVTFHLVCQELSH